MQIPDYIIKAVYTHYRRISEHADCLPCDHRTKDALRQSKRDLQRLEKYIKDAEKNRNAGPAVAAALGKPSGSEGEDPA
ncbi:MAG: hypothetical protein K1V90_08680 [Muribaculaceae bacterium]